MEEEKQLAGEDRLSGEIVEVYRQPLPGEVVERYSRPLPGRPAAPGQPRRRRRTGLWIFLACLAVVLGVAAGSWIWYLLPAGSSADPFEYRYDHGWEEEEDASGAVTIPTYPFGEGAVLEVETDHGRELTAQEIYQRVNPSVVTVMVQLDDSVSVGTGVIFRADGYILTNYHVLAGGRDCTVAMDTGRTYEARYVAGDERNDLAVLKVELTGLPAATFGDSDQLVVGESVYTISASTENAYNAAANKFIHTGEEVYLSCYSDASRTGTGVVTSVSGTDFTVEVRSGEFLIGETVSVFRGEAVSSQRIGRGTLSRRTPTAVTASGSIVSIAVRDGDSVQKGDLLLETLDGDFDGLYMSGSEIRATVSGTVAQISLQEGARTEKDAAAATIYPDGAMRVEAQVAETDLGEIHVGDAVNVELLWNEDSETVYPGTVTMISAIAEESQQQEDGDGAVCYMVYIDFTPDENTRYGMSAVVTTLDAGEAAGDSND